MTRFPRSELMKDCLSLVTGLFYAYVQFVVQIGAGWTFANFALIDVTFGVRYTYKRPPPGLPGLAILATAGFKFEATIITVGLQLGCCRPDQVMADAGMYFELKKLTLFEVMNGFKKIFTGGKTISEDGVLYALFNPVTIKIEVCVAMSEIKFVNLDAECSKGFEFSAELELWTTVWSLSAEAELPQNVFGGVTSGTFDTADITIGFECRRPNALVYGFIQQFIDKFTSGRPNMLVRLFTKFIKLWFKVFSIEKVAVEVTTDGLTEGTPIEFDIQLKILGIFIQIKFPPEPGGSLDTSGISSRGVMGLFMNVRLALRACTHRLPHLCAFCVAFHVVTSCSIDEA